MLNSLFWKKHFSNILKKAVCMGKLSGGFYAVRQGRCPGVYLTWAECESQVKGFSKATFKKFATEKEALLFIKNESTLKLPLKQKKRKLDDVISEEKEGAESSNSVSVYTDGACCFNGRDGAKAGIGVYWGPNHPLNVSERLPGRQTNNRAEIHAAIRALQQAKQIGASNVTIYTDSGFLVKGTTEWIFGWKKNGWKLSTGGQVKNKEDFEALETAKEGLKVNWVHVPGHQGIYGNEQADKLAVEALNKSL